MAVCILAVRGPVLEERASMERKTRGVPISETGPEAINARPAVNLVVPSQLCHPRVEVSLLWSTQCPPSKSFTKA